MYVLAIPSIITNSGATTTTGSLRIENNALSGTLLFNGRSLTNATTYNPNARFKGGVVFSRATLPTNDIAGVISITNMITELKIAYRSTPDIASNSSVANLIAAKVSIAIQSLRSTIMKDQLGESAVNSGSSIAPTVAFTCGTFIVTGRSPDSTVYQTVTGADGKCWLNSNLGTANVATSSTDSTAYGWLYQWGRLTDGYQITTSALVMAQSTSDNPGNASFIIGFLDWRFIQNDALSTTWGGANSTSSPCAIDWRLPTQGEWAALVTAAGIINSATAFSSSLKLTDAGNRSESDGSLVNQWFRGYYC